MNQRRNDENTEKHEKRRIQDFTDPRENAGRPERKEQDNREESKRKQREIQTRIAGTAEILLDAHRERNRRRSGDGEERSDRKIEKRCEDETVPVRDAVGHVEQSFAPRNTHGHDAEKRKTHSRDKKADGSRQNVSARHLSHIYREYKVTRAEEKPEQHRCDGYVFFFTK